MGGVSKRLREWRSRRVVWEKYGGGKMECRSKRGTRGERSEGVSE